MQNYRKWPRRYGRSELGIPSAWPKLICRSPDPGDRSRLVGEIWTKDCSRSGVPIWFHGLGHDDRDADSREDGC